MYIDICVHMVQGDILMEFIVGELSEIDKNINCNVIIIYF